MFEGASLHLEATRRHVEQQLAAQASEIGALLARSEQEAGASIDRYRRVQRAFQDGHIEPEDWTDQRRALVVEQEATDAEVARLRARSEEITEQIADADGETFQRLADLRAAVAGKIGGSSDDIGALRAALGAVSAVKLRDVAYVRKAIAADIDAIERGGFPEPDGLLYGGVGAYRLDFYGSWERVAIGLQVPIANRLQAGCRCSRRCSRHPGARGELGDDLRQLPAPPGERRRAGLLDA
jgi:hypothetical protein